jgi:hypothetical protein
VEKVKKTLDEPNRNINKEKKLNRNPKKILELKITLTEMKNSL